MGRKLPTIKHGLQMSQHARETSVYSNDADTHMLWVSRRMVKEKQHRNRTSFDLGSGFLMEQLVSMAFWLG